MKQKMFDTKGPEQGNPTTSSDGILKDLAAKAKSLAPALAEGNNTDPRRRGVIEITGNKNSLKRYLFIDDQMWAEVQWSQERNMWCIQDHCGYCLFHIEHLQREIPNGGNTPVYSSEDLKPDQAIEVAKQMIRDGSMPSPEEAKEAFKKRTNTSYRHVFRKTDFL